MNDTLEQRDDTTPTNSPPPSPAPTDSPAPSSAPAPSDALDELLAQYDAAVKQQADAEPSAVDGEQAAAALRNIDATATLHHGDARLAELQGENAALKNHLWREAESAAFKSFAADLQDQLPSHVPPEFAETALLAAAATNPDLIAAFDLRNADRRAADLELRRVEVAFAKAQNDPNVDQRKLADLYQYGRRLALAINSPEILRKAKADIAARVKKFKPIDEDATFDRAMVAAAVRDAHGKIAPERPPDLGSMSSKEFRNYVKSLGFDSTV